LRRRRRHAPQRGLRKKQIARSIAEMKMGTPVSPEAIAAVLPDLAELEPSGV
jgi:hypothetical protein